MSTELLKTIQESVFNLQFLVGRTVPLQIRISTSSYQELIYDYGPYHHLFSPEQKTILGHPVVIDDDMPPNEITVDTMQ